jgi:hypothetical protein
MKYAQFEYNVVSMQDSTPHKIESMLNEAGEAGWELINITGGPSTFYYFFKRAITLLHS